MTLASGESSGRSGDMNIASGVTTSSESSGSVILQTGSSQAGAAGNVVHLYLAEYSDLSDALA